MDSLETQRQLLATLLVKVGVMASFASILVRSGQFKDLLFRESRSRRERVELGIFFGIPLALGVVVRVLLHYKAPDLALEGALLGGALGGCLTGAVTGLLVALPGLPKEWLAPPVLVVAGLVGGAMRHLSPQTEQIWAFSPFVDMNIYRWYRQRFGKPRGDWQVLFFAVIVLVEAIHIHAGRAFPGRLFLLDTHYKAMLVAIVLAGVASIAIPVKIWNNTHNEIKLEEQNRLLAEARMAALTSQINPHFLFNTLNSISSLIRTDPELARVLIHKLSSILRRLLRRHETFAQLREELSFIDDYLSIERVRFGDKLQIIKEVDESALDAMVPSMLLQPIVENCIRHGVGPKVDGGTIRIRSSREDGRLRIEVRDNGVGIPSEKLPEVYEDGIGLSNVNERMKVLYGADYSFRIQSRPGEGTEVEIELPDLQQK